MLDKVKELIGDVSAFKATSKEDIESFRIQYLGSKGLLKELFAEFKNVDAALRKDCGQALNNLKKVLPCIDVSSNTSVVSSSKKPSSAKKSSFPCCAIAEIDPKVINKTTIYLII